MGARLVAQMFSVELGVLVDADGVRFGSFTRHSSVIEVRDLIHDTVERVPLSHGGGLRVSPRPHDHTSKGVRQGLEDADRGDPPGAVLA
jgi:hypothetical protein